MSAFISPRGWSMTIWLIVFNILLITILALRFYAARLQQRSFRLDDGFITLAYVSLLAMECPTFWAIANGLGAHTYQMNAQQKTVQAKLVLSASWSWTIATVSCKLALLAFYNVVFTTRRFRLISYTMMGVCVSYAIAFIPIFMTQCEPPAASWNPTLGHCRPIQREEYASVSISMALDLIIVILPLPTIWALQMPLRRKIGVSFVFSLGLLTVAIMAWRIQSTVQATKSSDSEYGLYYTTLQSHLELWLGIIGASLPTLAPIASKLIIPAVSRFISSHQKFANSSGYRKNANPTVGDSDGAVPLQNTTGFARVEESPVGTSDVQHWGKAEGAGTGEILGADMDGDRLDAITVRHGYGVFAEPRQQV